MKMNRLTQVHAELVKKYSFIRDAYINGTSLVIEYMKDGKLKFKKVAIRATVPQLQKIIKHIRKEIRVSTYGKSQNSCIYIT